MTLTRTYRSAAFGTNGISTRSLGKPAAAFPGRIATDADLAIAVDRQQTHLALAMGTGDTSMTVSDPSLIVANSLLSIDAEIVRVTAAPAGNVVPVARGFDGTTPAIHAANAPVSGFVDAFHHNGLTSEIEAIETALGANLANVGSGPWLISTAFIFSPQTPGGTLSSGAQVVTLTPVPKGVNGTDQNHYLYISGGTGAAEAVPIVGGTAVGGAASGTVIVTCANAHSGAWTIQSATAGIQEALDSMASPQVLVPAGNYNIYATISVPNRGSVNGFSFSQNANGGPTMLLYQQNTGSCIDLRGDQTAVRFLHIRQMVAYTAQTFTAASGNIGVQCWNVSPRTANAALVENVQVEAFYQNFSFDSNNNLWLTNLIATGATQDNIVFAGCNGHGQSLLSQSALGNGISTKVGTNGQALAPMIDQVEIYNNTGWGLNWFGAGQWGDVTSQANGLGDYYFHAASASVFHAISSDSAGISVNGYTHAPTGTATGVGAFFDAGAEISIAGLTVSNANGNAVRIAGSGNLVSSVTILTPNRHGNTDDNQYGLLITAGFNVVYGLAGDQYTAVKISGSAAYFNAIYAINLNNSNLTIPVIELFSGATSTMLSGMVIPSSGTAVKTDAGSSLIFNPALYTYTAVNSFAAGTILAPTAPTVPAASNGGILAVTANAITITGQVSHVGAGLIKTINLGNGAGSSAGYLIADAAFTTDQTGNINSAPLTAVAGTMYTWVLDANSGKFYIR